MSYKGLYKEVARNEGTLCHYPARDVPEHWKFWRDYVNYNPEDRCNLNAD